MPNLVSIDFGVTINHKNGLIKTIQTIPPQPKFGSVNELLGEPKFTLRERAHLRLRLRLWGVSIESS